MSEVRHARGQVWWTETPTLSRRPSVIVTRASSVAVVPRLLVAPLTTRPRGLATEVTLSVSDGLPRECVAQLDSPELVNRGYLVDLITTLSEQRMLEICAALRVATGC